MRQLIVKIVHCLIHTMEVMSVKFFSPKGVNLPLPIVNNLPFCQTTRKRLIDIYGKTKLHKPRRKPFMGTIQCLVAFILRNQLNIFGIF